MINSLYIFILKMHEKHVTEGNFFLVVAELVATLIAIATICNA